MSYIRPATHAAPRGRGWYEAAPDKLQNIIERYFSKTKQADGVPLTEESRLAGIIAPHAGMDYSGATASEVYSVLHRYLYAPRGKGKDVERVFILGPSHVKGYSGFELTTASAYDTPFGPLRVDVDILSSLERSFAKAGIPVKRSSKAVDEKEHSIEMQTPFISYVLHYPPPGSSNAAPAASKVSIVPMVIGFTDPEDEAQIASVLESYMKDSRNVFVYSSDFCHWGSRFGYQYWYEQSNYTKVGDSIIAMDHAAMKLLEKKNLEGWYKFLKKTETTICGRHAIGVGLQRWAGNANASISFLGYSQSNYCASTEDSSVSYAAAVIFE